MLGREERIRRIQKNPEISVLIVGAGINGIGTFRDLAFQGLDVLLIDRGDYCSGASAASSHMVHGGIRYLENGEFRLVREAVQERNHLIENAPHLVKPLPTTFPIFKWFSGLLNAPLKFLGLLGHPAERGALVIKIGMTLYDVYTRQQKTVPKHVFRNREESLKLFPALNPDVIYTGTYYDAAMPSPERIAIELIKDAVAENDSAIPLNYVSLVSAQEDSVTLKDELNEKEFKVKPKILVNAGGPWIDLINGKMGSSTQYIGGTKGSHLILDHTDLRNAIDGNEFFFENEDGRIVLIFPLMDKVLIGTSDIRIDNPDEAVITEEEVDYFFAMIQRVFPGIEVDRSQIVYTFSGVRPLPYTEGSLTGQISRDHKIEVINPGKGTNFPIFSLVGGKWTSFRALAEQTSDLVLAHLGLERKFSTKALPIGGGENYPRSDRERETWISRHASDVGLASERMSALFERYGTRANEVTRYVVESGVSQLHEQIGYSEGELAYLVQQEDVQHLDDLILRRTMLAKLGLASSQILRKVGKVVAHTMGWSSEKVSRELDRLVDKLAQGHRVADSKYIDEVDNQNSIQV